MCGAAYVCNNFIEDFYGNDLIKRGTNVGCFSIFLVVFNGGSVKIQVTFKKLLENLEKLSIWTSDVIFTYYFKIGWSY